MFGRIIAKADHFWSGICHYHCHCVTCELCFSVTVLHLSLPASCVTAPPMSAFHHDLSARFPTSTTGPIVPLLPARLQSGITFQLQSSFNLEPLHMTHDAREKPTIWRAKKWAGTAVIQVFKVDSQQQKEKEPKVDFITLCFLRGVLACCRVASQTLICPLKPSSSSPSQTSQGCSLNITNIRSQYTVFLLCGEIKETLNIFQSN